MSALKAIRRDLFDLKTELLVLNLIRHFHEFGVARLREFQSGRRVR